MTHHIGYIQDSKLEPFTPSKERRPHKASSFLAFTSGAKAAVPVLLGLIPLAVVCGTTATGTGLSALQALALSVRALVQFSGH